MQQMHIRMMAVLLACTTFLVGCGSTGQTAQAYKQTGNPPFRNELNVEKGPVDTKFDPIPGSANIYQKIPVLNQIGKKVYLDAGKYPILFEAYWCPHCQRTLVLLMHNRSKVKQMPILVSMGFAPKTSLQQAVQLSHEEFHALHIKDVQVYYLLNVNPGKYVPTVYPTLAFLYQHQISLLAGEHIWPVWQKALT